MAATAGKAAAPASTVFAGLCGTLAGTGGGSFLPALCSVGLHSVNSVIHLSTCIVQDILCAIQLQGVCIRAQNENESFY